MSDHESWADKAIFGIVDGGPAKAVVDGFYILTEPLKNGTYPIHFKSSLICPDPDCADPNFVQDITYNQGLASPACLNRESNNPNLSLATLVMRK